jgi:hypothetical protein
MFAVRPTHLLTGALLAGMLVTSGCGDIGKPAAPRRAGPKKPAFTGTQVAAFFRAVTGDPLRSEPSAAFDSVMPDRSDYDRSDLMSDRYGSFLIFVLHRAGADTIYKTDRGTPVRPDAQGIYWHDDGGSWTAMKPYRNVVLSWTADDRAVDERFARLDAVLSRLGRPAEQVRAALPAEDRPCAEEPTGTCRDPESGVTVSTVERSQRLELPDLQVRVTGLKTGRAVVPASPYGLVRRAKGRYVAIAVKVKNTGNEPLDGLYEAKLKIGDRLYEQSGEATYAVSPRNAFPLQPDDSTVAAVVFDVPLQAARKAVREGLIAFPAGVELSSVENAARIGQIRLAKPSAAAPAGGTNS